jgi:hypothetical protein
MDTTPNSNPDQILHAAQNVRKESKDETRGILRARAAEVLLDMGDTGHTDNVEAELGCFEGSDVKLITCGLFEIMNR